MRRALLAVVALVAALAIFALASSAGAQTSEPVIPAASWYLVGDDGDVLARHDAAAHGRSPASRSS
jgi:D-alanyl-D-alanine carboxypeptidase